MFSKRNKPKIFCVGLNKTGTTTLEKTLQEFDFKLGNQRKGELLTSAWSQRNFSEILRFCHTADAFQDIPFSLPFTYIVLDQYFVNAKFILTVRDSDDQWYQSITKFHSKLWADGLRVPTLDDLKNAKYCYKGYAFDLNRLLYNTPESDPYNEEIFKKHYNDHKNAVIDYFKNRSDKLLVINVSKKEDYGRLCKFLNREALRDDFLWENKTTDIK